MTKSSKAICHIREHFIKDRVGFGQDRHQRGTNQAFSKEGFDFVIEAEFKKIN